MERQRTRGNYLSEDLIAGRSRTEVGRRSHRLNVRVDETLYRRIRKEAEAVRLPVAQVLRLALVAGVDLVKHTHREAPG